jgi:RNA polymerase sigma-70 factor, ECF subfamily
MSEIEQRFARIYEDTRKDLYSYIIRSMREEHTSQDILQDVYLNFFRIFQQKSPPDDRQCRMYLFRIARNLMINHSRRFYIRQVDLVEGYDTGPGAAGSAEPAQGVEDAVVDRMEAEEQEKILGELLGELEEEHRTALILRFQLDMRLEDIARVLQCSVSTASRTLQKAQQAVVRAGERRGLKPA